MIGRRTPGAAISGLVSLPPASSRAPLNLGSAARRLARMHPATPPPTITKSNSRRSMRRRSRSEFDDREDVAVPVRKDVIEFENHALAELACAHQVSLDENLHAGRAIGVAGGLAEYGGSIEPGVDGIIATAGAGHADVEGGPEGGIVRVEILQDQDHPFQFLERSDEEAEVEAGFEILRHHRAVRLDRLVLVIAADAQRCVDRGDQLLLRFGQAGEVDDTVAPREVAAGHHEAVEIAAGKREDLGFLESGDLEQARG